MEWYTLVGAGTVFIGAILGGIWFMLNRYEHRAERSADKRDVSLNQRIDDTFGRLDKRIDDTFVRLDKRIDDTFGSLNIRLERVEASLNTLSGRVQDIDKRIAVMERP